MCATKTKGIQRQEDGYKVDKIFRGQRIQQRGFENFEDAEAYLAQKVNRIREEQTLGKHVGHTFDEAAAEYLQRYSAKTSIKSDVYHLAPVMPFIGHLKLDQIHNGTLKEFISARKAQVSKVKVSKNKVIDRPLRNKTINHSLAIVRRVLKLAAKDWRDANNMTWLQTAPMITLLPLTDSREPRPIQWEEQRRLMQLLPDHLAKMSLFVLNTGVRDDVVCSLRWDWEIRDIPEIGGNSIFIVPVEHVKGEDKNVTEKVIICNDAAQSVIESVREKHKTHVFVWRRERVKNMHEAPAMPYRPVESMNNTAWQNARQRAGLGDLHVHDLRHTVGMRLRESKVLDRTLSDVLWHSTGTMTGHYSIAQIIEIFDALQLIKDESSRPNRSLRTIIFESKNQRLTQKSLTTS